MASVKIASLFLKTLSKPIANRLKKQAKEHERFREATISFAQFLHRSEMKMRVKLLGETHPLVVRPLNDARAIDAGANFISETFLFAFAAGISELSKGFLPLLLGSPMHRHAGVSKSCLSRTLFLTDSTVHVHLVCSFGRELEISKSRRETKDAVHEALDSHETQLTELKKALEEERIARNEGLGREEQLEKIVDEIVGIGLRGGFIDPSPAWKSHVRSGDLARVFRTTEHVANDSEDDAPSTVLVELERMRQEVNGSVSDRFRQTDSARSKSSVMPQNEESLFVDTAEGARLDDGTGN